MDIDSTIIKEYFNRLAMQNIKAQSYNNKLQVISAFLRYLQVTGCISEFSNPIALYYKKNYPTVNEIDKIAAAHFMTLFNDTFFIPSIMVKYRSNPFSPVL